MLLDERTALAGAVERQHVVAARERRRAVCQVQLLNGAVVAAGEDDRRAGVRVGCCPEEVARQRHLFIRDLEDLWRAVHQRAGTAEHLSLFGVGVLQVRVQRRAQQQDSGGAVIRGGAEVREPGRFPVAGGLGLGAERG
ncbi:MAG TPA: hypothetical protein VMG37_05860 [Solirubrobacteraceae bacterium]|nr:hypothetical protein [Solirubrobacteraceae bacterium]